MKNKNDPQIDAEVNKVLNMRVEDLPIEGPTPDYEKAARHLFDLLDDIDTVSDIAKSNDSAYRKAVEEIQKRRFEVASTDGYTVTFK